MQVYNPVMIALLPSNCIAIIEFFNPRPRSVRNTWSKLSCHTKHIKEAETMFMPSPKDRLPIIDQDHSTAMVASLRTPCKARGVQGQQVHNAKNAYIDVPFNAEHGTILSCSNEACRNSGRRFRYCSICKIPVAFRNFGKRHSHGILQPPSLIESKVLVPPTGIQQSSQPVHHLQDTSSGTVRTDEKNAAGDQDTSSTLHNIGGSIPNTIWVGETDDQSLQDLGLVKIYATPREVRWLALLRDRPADHESGAIEFWLEDIMQVSSKIMASTCSTRSGKRIKRSLSCCRNPSPAKISNKLPIEPTCSRVKDDSCSVNGSACSAVKESSMVASSCTGAKVDSCIRGSILSCTGKNDNCCEHIEEFDMMDVQDELKY